MIEKSLFTLSETAFFFFFSIATIRKCSSNGRLPTIKFLKRSVRVSLKVIESLLNNCLPNQAAGKEDKNA
jgi:hypothetical protein